MNHEVVIQRRKINLSDQDPADRFMTASALVYDLTLITSDKLPLGLDNVELMPD